MKKICVIRRMPTQYESESKKKVIYLEEPIVVTVMLLLSFILIV